MKLTLLTRLLAFTLLVVTPCMSMVKKCTASVRDVAEAVKARIVDADDALAPEIYAVEEEVVAEEEPVIAAEEYPYYPYEVEEVIDYVREETPALPVEEYEIEPDEGFEIVEDEGIEIDEDVEIIPFSEVDVKPRFQGGDANDFAKWVNQHLIYPDVAKDNGIQGRVVLQFTIGTDGILRDVKVLRGVDPALDREAVRVVSMSPAWSPGMSGDRRVMVTYTFPVIFIID